MHYGNVKPHIAQGLIELRKRIDKAKIPSSKLDESLNIATWNIREFGRKRRLDASIYYIAEILNQFDLIALTELRDNLSDLRRIMDLLGNEWEVVFSDFTDDAGGNNERIAFLYDTRMVRFTGLAAEADPPRAKDQATKEWQIKFGWWRSPYMGSFSAGSFDFVVIAAHIRWAGGVTDRLPPLKLLGEWVKNRRENKYAVDKDFIVMGDFNIPSRRSSAFNALTNNGKDLLIPSDLLNVKGTNLSQRNTYDQILHSPTPISRFSGEGGALDFYANDWKKLYPKPSHRPASKTKFTYEMSDHLPLWLQVQTDIVDNRLQILSGR